jgi:hypothetical protein
MSSLEKFIILAIIVGVLLLSKSDRIDDYESTKANVNAAPHDKHSTDVKEVETVFLVGDTYPLLRDGVIPIASARRDASI